MKPAICKVCGTYSADDNEISKAGWIEFIDYKPEEKNSISHPEGLEYFCSKHFSHANQLKHKKMNDALVELAMLFVPEKHVVTDIKSSWWKRFLKI